MARSRDTVTGIPLPSMLIWEFWQKQQRRLQLEKKTVPDPRLPLMHGSSQKCRAARASTGWSGLWQ